MSTTTGRTVALMAGTLVVGLMVGALAGAAVLVGPAGYRPAKSAAINPGSSPSTSRPSSVLPSPSTLPTPRRDVPSPREYAAMAFDAVIGEMVLFGGLDAATGRMDGDTWTWNGRRWKQRPRKDSDPLPRATAGMAYDANRGLIVLHGGIDDAHRSLTDTWLWDGTQSQWIQAKPDQSPPTFLAESSPMVWDPDHGRVLLFAFVKSAYLTYDVPALDQLWAWDGTNWSALNVGGAPTGHEHYDAAMVYDTARKQAVFFAHADELIPTATTTRLGESAVPTTWTFDGSAWTKASNTGPAKVVDGRLIAADDADRNVVMLDSQLDTWTWDGAQWNLRAPAHAPTGRFRTGAAIAYDPVRRVVVLFGGRRDFGLLAVWNDTWIWNGADWIQVG